MPRSLLAVMMLVLASSGCSSPPRSTDFIAPAGEYASAFQTAKDELRHAGFTLDRIDASAGVLTTISKGSAGFASPWIDDESTLAQEWEGLLNHQRRRVIVRFEPADDALAEKDLRTNTGETRITVNVEIARIYRPGLRVPDASVRFASQAIDPVLRDRALTPTYQVFTREDEKLAARLSERISNALASHIDP